MSYVTHRTHGSASKPCISAPNLIVLPVASKKLHRLRLVQPDDYFFAHAGVKPGVELLQQKESDLLWIRNEFLNSREDFGKIIVHGHTPTLEIEVEPNRINIDTGAFATGRLTCLVLEGASLSFIDTD